MVKILFSSIVLYLALTNLMAREITILDVTNNSADEKYDYKMVLNVNSSNEITKFYVDSYLKGNHQAGIQNRDVRHIGNLEQGFVLVKRQNYDVAILRSTNFISDIGGDMELFYLYRGSLSGSGGNYKKKNLTLLSHGNDWQVYTENNESVDYADFKVNKLFGIEVGISDIYFR